MLLIVDFYKEFHKGSVIFRTNRSYLVENVQTKGLNKRLRSTDCLTDLESRIVDRQIIINGKMKLFRKNDYSDFWHIVRSSDDTRRSSFIRYLSQSNQKLSARIAENGGGFN